jgi:hypothetical protein
LETFTYYNPTRLIYGIDQTHELASQLPKNEKILLVYGGGSIKKNGLYDTVLDQLNQAGAEVTELAGIEPNPRLKTVRRGIELCKENGISFILAVGGGSVIDATKAIAVGAKFNGDIWDVITKKETATAALPFGTILTLAATGSEMNAGSVITNWDTNEKIGWGSPYSFPTFSILDPKNTLSVPRDHTVYGMVDMMSHVLEAYFNRVENTPLQDRICESILKTVIETAPQLLEDPTNLEHRGTILYCGTMALNGVTQMGARGDWGSHNIEHAVSAISDIPHAGGLAIIFPHWLRNSIDENPKPHVQLAVRVLNVDPEGKTDQEIAEEGIQKLSEFWTSLGAPNRLADYDIDESQIDRMAGIAAANGEFGRYAVLNKEDTARILTAAL